MATNDQSIAQVTMRGTLWSYGINYGGKFVSLVSTIVLARLLSQDDFGVAGYALIFTNFIDVFAGLGIPQAVIFHKLEPKMKDTAFWSSVLIGVILFVVTWITAPLGGMYFQDPRATPVIQALGLTYPISALSNVQSALLRKEFSFGKQFIPEFLSAIAKAVIAIGLAYMGFGPWSLVIGQIGSKLVSTVVYWVVFPWLPSLSFIKDQCIQLIKYGANSSLVDIVNVFQSNVDYLLISRFLGAAALGVYTLAFKIPEILIMQFCGAVTNVIFPVFSKLKDDAATLRNGFLQATQYSSVIVVPTSLGLALIAQPVVLLLFSEKWLDAIPVIRAISIYMLAVALPFNAGLVYRAKGQQFLLTKITVAEIAILAPALYWVVNTFHSIVMVGWAQSFFAVLFGCVQVIIATKMLDTTLLSFLLAVGPALISGIVMSIAVLCISAFSSPLGLWSQLIISIITGAFFYIMTLFLIKREIIVKINQTIKGVLIKSA